MKECIQFKFYVNDETDIQEMFSIIHKNILEATFPNIHVALRIFLSMMVSNSTGERSFSKLKIIQNDLRNSMSESRLNSLFLMSIESDLLATIDFADVINEFSSLKLRNKPI